MWIHVCSDVLGAQGLAWREDGGADLDGPDLAAPGVELNAPAARGKDAAHLACLAHAHLGDGEEDPRPKALRKRPKRRRLQREIGPESVPKALRCTIFDPRIQLDSELSLSFAPRQARCAPPSTPGKASADRSGSGLPRRRQTEPNLGVSRHRPIRPMVFQWFFDRFYNCFSWPGGCGTEVPMPLLRVHSWQLERLKSTPLQPSVPAQRALQAARVVSGELW